MCKTKLHIFHNSPRSFDIQLKLNLLLSKFSCKLEVEHFIPHKWAVLVYVKTGKEKRNIAAALSMSNSKVIVLWKLRYKKMNGSNLV